MVVCLIFERKSGGVGGEGTVRGERKSGVRGSTNYEDCFLVE